MEESQRKYLKNLTSIARILTEERIYDDELVYLTEEKSSSKTTKRSHKQKSKKRRRTTFSYKQVKFSKTSFGLTSTFFKFITLFILLFSSQFSVYLMLAPDSKRVTNLMRVYISGVELWNCYDSAFTMFYDTVLFNNSVGIWDGKKTLDGYNYFKEKIQERVLVNYTELLEVDLGNMTEGFRNTLTKVSFTFD